MSKQNTTRNLVLCALFVALTAVLSQIAIPVQPVPINLATLSVMLAGGVLGAKNGAVSQAVYVLMGAIGLPVFSSFSGGIGIVAGPTGGYIIGYIAAAWLIGLLAGRCGGKVWQLALVMTAGELLCYLLGTAWFMIFTGTGLLESLLLCVVPFLLGDAAKIVVASLLVPALNRALGLRKKAGAA
ncbi:biotin transporter BioY [Clostridium sp. D33t1_170424_F3]|uniref:biotin transporter BioY n=1 Tax=Clostridium sp. D33t1_170424_F3 TaxID=2787099 RepID=UPI0018A8F62E|nr:biotin transporter BioY [Clostridium sp. D33t1_170424_F3]